jgi:hypothetical protein
VTDHDELRELSYRYTFALDDGDFAAVARILEHAVLRPDMPGVAGEPVSGRAALEEFYHSQVVVDSRGRPMTRHLITNQVIELADDRLTATSRSYFTVLQRPAGEPYQIVVGGQYHDTFDRVDGRWRFSSKRIQVEHLNAIEHHFRIANEHSA